MTNRRRPIIPATFSTEVSSQTKNAKGVVYKTQPWFMSSQSWEKMEEQVLTDTECRVCDTVACTCVYPDRGVYSDDHLRLYGINPQSRIDLLARQFYGAMALNMMTKGVYQAQMDAITDYVADQLARAIVLACIGEARYDVQLAMYGLWAARVRKGGKQALDLPIYRNRLINVFELNVGGRPSTREAAAEPMARLGNPLDESTVRMLRNIFLWAGRYAHGLSTSYGGLMWASCAQIVLDYITKRTSAVEFIDHAFDARHNGAPVLSKVLSQAVETEAWLTARAEASLEWVARWAPNAVREQFGFPAVVPLPMRHSVVNFSEDGVTHSIIPDDQPVKYIYIVPNRQTLYVNSAKSPQALMDVMLDRLRDDETFLLVASGSVCDHARANANHPLNFEHDCDKVCKPTCHCRRYVPRTQFKSRTDAAYGVEDPDDEYEEDEIWCSLCKTIDHETSECPFGATCVCCYSPVHSEYGVHCSTCDEPICAGCVDNGCHVGLHAEVSV